MIGYVFWHRPSPGVDVAAYEAGMLGFHARLGADPPSGFLGSHTLRLPPRPPLPWPEPAWLDGGGYEDWYLLEGFADLDPLKAAALDGARVRSHEAVATLSGHGAAGVYQLLSGAPNLPQEVAWWSKPAGTAYEAVAFDGVGQTWQRQLVLGPAPEFRLVRAKALAPGSPDTARPVPGWTAVQTLPAVSSTG